MEAILTLVYRFCFEKCLGTGNSPEVEVHHLGVVVEEVG